MHVCMYTHNACYFVIGYFINDIITAERLNDLFSHT